jgi:hypothetical protein
MINGIKTISPIVMSIDVPLNCPVWQDEVTAFFRKIVRLERNRG